MLRRVVLAMVAVGVCGVWGLMGCGGSAEQETEGARILAKADYGFKGEVVDQNGTRLNEVIVSISMGRQDGVVVSEGGRTGRAAMTERVGGSEDVQIQDTLLRRADGSFVFEKKAPVLSMVFTKEGYQDTTLRVESWRAGRVMTEKGNWPYVRDFPIVLIEKKKSYPAMERWDGYLNYTKWPMGEVVNVPGLWTKSPLVEKRTIGEAKGFEAGILYVTVVKRTPDAMDAKGTIDPRDLGLPGEVTLHVSGEGNGFVRMTPRVGYSPLYTTDEAPADGYMGELTFGRARLKQMRDANAEDVLEGQEYFFVKVNGHFGKGRFRYGGESNSESVLKFRLDVAVNAKADDRNVAMRFN